MNLDLHLPTEVVFGRGRLAELGLRVADRGSRPLLLCGRHAMRRHGVLAAAVGSLEAAGLRVTVLEDVSPDPRSDEVDRAADAARRDGCDVVVGLGGGSALDAAKATAIALRHGPAGPLVGTTVGAVADPVPVVAVPTTAGSGSEVTGGAIVTDVRRSLKSGIRGRDVFPVLAVVDPALLASVPGPVAAESGFDALAHAVEGYVARRATPVNRALGLRAVELLGARLPELGSGPDPARDDDLALAALLGGFNVALAGSCLPHRVQQAMGSVPEVRIAHGRGLAAVYPAWLRHTEPLAAGAFAELAAALGGPDGGDLGGQVARLRERLGLDRSLAGHGFAAADLDRVLGGVTGALGNDPAPDPGPALIRTLLDESY